MSASLQIFLCIALLILAAKLCGAAMARIGLPLVLGELLAGVLLGPTFINIWRFQWFSASGPAHVSVVPVFKVLADIGVVLLMFLAGLETDVDMMRSAVAPAFWAATGGVILPMVGGAFLAHAAGYSWQHAIFIGTILTATSVTITAQTLMNLKQLQSKAGSTILGAAVIDDVLGLIVLSVVIALAPSFAHSGAASWRGLAVTLGRMVLCLALLGFVGPPFVRWVFRCAERLHGSHTEVSAALIIAFLFAFQAEWFGGMAAITGSYLAGLFVAGTPAHRRVLDDLQPMINSFFGPLFFVSIGLEVDILQLGSRVEFFIALLLVAIFGKIIGCGLGSRFTGFSWRESLIVGVGMIPRGEVGLITASLGFAAGVVTRDVYVQVVVVVLLSTLITPGLLRFAFPRSALVGEVLPSGAMELQRLDTAVDKMADV